MDGPGEGEDTDNKVIIERFFGLTGALVMSYCGSKGKLIDRYHGCRSPVGVGSGKLSGKMNYNGDSCGVLATVIHPTPGEERQIAFLPGIEYEGEASAIVVAYEDMKAVCDVQTGELITYQREELSHFQVKTPSKEFDIVINTWGAYNCFMMFI